MDSVTALTTLKGRTVNDAKQVIMTDPGDLRQWRILMNAEVGLLADTLHSILSFSI